MAEPKFFQQNGSNLNPAVPSDIDENVAFGMTQENLREKRYLWTVRAFAIIGAVSIVSNIVLLISLYALLPLRRTQPFFLSFDDKNTAQVVFIEQMAPNEGTISRVTESMFRQYIILRHSVVPDVSIMMSRWGENGAVRWWSSPAIFREFNTTTQEMFRQIQADGLTRKINILSVYPKVVDQNIWEAEVETVDMFPERREPVRNRYLISAQIEYNPSERVYEDRFKNPVGFQIKQYGLVHKGKEN